MSYEHPNNGRGSSSAVASSAPFRIARSREPDGSVVLSLRGELDLVSGQILEAALSDPATGGAGRVVLDLSGLEFMDSTGIGVLVRAQLRAAERSQQLMLRNLHSNIDRLFEITGIASRFTIV